jgi:predicted TIM-barrel fold metal-dependent hydrolase
VIDLSDIAVIDNHCHAVDAVQKRSTQTWRAAFTESHDPQLKAEGAADTAYYRRLVHAMALYYQVRTEDEVLEARDALGAEQLVGTLFRDAGIGGVVIDTGYPAPEKAMDVSAFTAASGSEYTALLRLEVAFQQLVVQHDTYEALIDAARDLVEDARADGFAGFKSIVAYRTGLAIERWSAEAALSAFTRARAELAATGTVRLGHKPLLDTLLHIAFEAAAEQELPVQFHVGYGDTDVDLRKASPLELRTILAEPAYRAMPVVLLHGCWPYTREGAYLAAVYGNAYLDLSYGIPFLSVGEMTAMTRAALAVAPFGKLMYSSDGTGIPELHWMAAHDGRRAIGTVLGELVADRELNRAEAGEAGVRILRDNAARLYGMGGAL